MGFQFLSSKLGFLRFTGASEATSRAFQDPPGARGPGRPPAAAIEAFATVCQLFSSSEGLLRELELQICSSQSRLFDGIGANFGVFFAAWGAITRSQTAQEARGRGWEPSAKVFAAALQL